MKPLNYFKRIIKDCRKWQGNQPNEERENFLKSSIQLAEQCVKFILPPGGRVLEDLQFKCLDETQPLRLPFPVCGFEYERTIDDTLLPGEMFCPKAAFVAFEQKGVIMILMFCWNSGIGWAPVGFVGLPETGYLDRGADARELPAERSTYKKEHGVPLRLISYNTFGMPSLPPSDFVDEAGALLCFLNALQCSNVEVTTIPRQTGHLTHKDALKVDQYHVLSIRLPKGAHGGLGQPSEMHRSPREHLRRGHIRMLQSGEKIWVNSTVVNAGKGYGKITKDYRIK